MIALSLLGLGLSFATGWCVVRWAFRGQTPGGSVALAAALSTGIGLGLGSGAHLVSLWLAPASPWLFVGMDIALLGLALLLLRVGRGRPAPAALDTAPPAVASSGIARLLGILFWVALVLAVPAWLAFLLTKPHGNEWDAWLIWNLKARFFFRGGEGWLHNYQLLTSSISRPEYPLLLPLTTERLWRYAGTDSVLVPAAVGLTFTLATLFLLVGSVTALRGRSQGYLAGLILLGTVTYLRLGVSQIADVPLSFFVLTAIVLATLAIRRGDGAGRMWVLTGLAAGCAAWTKNEGSVLLMSLTGALILVTLGHFGPGAAVRRMLPYLLGVLVMAVFLVWLKLRVSAQSDNLQNITPYVIRLRLLDFSHHWHLITGCLRTLARIPDNLVLIVLPIYVALAGRRPGAMPRSALWVGGLAIAGMLIVEYAIFLFSYLSLDYLIQFASYRLFMQVLPASLFIILLAVKSPAELAGQSEAA